MAKKARKAAGKKAPAKKTPVKKPTLKKPFSHFEKDAGDKKIVLHIGCGMKKAGKLHQTFEGDEWYELRFDIDEDVNPDIVGDMTDMKAIPNKSVDAVYSSHNLEHLYPHMVPVALKEFYRVLKDEGHLLITMPDIETVASYVATGNLTETIYEAPAGPITPMDIIWGLRPALRKGNHFMAHRTGFTAKLLGELLRDIGFTNIRLSRDWVNLWGIAFKYPAEHEKRSERITIHKTKNEDIKFPAPPPVQKMPHPGAFAKGKLSDDLDLPPKMWEPLNLGKKKA